MSGNDAHIDFLKISIVLATSDDDAGLEQTLASVVHQHYPNCEIILVDRGSPGTNKRAYQKFSGSITKIIEKKGLSYFEALQLGFEQCDGECMTWIYPGAAFMNKALWAVNNIFKQHVDVKWLSGVPVFLNQQGAVVLEPDGFDVRWNRDRLMRENIKDIKRKLTGGNVFWRKNLWKQSGSSFDLQYQYLADIALWMKFMEHDPLMTAMIYLAGQPVDRKFNNEWQKEAEILQLESLPAESGIEKWLYNCYKLDLPYFRNRHHKRQPVQRVLKYDYDANSFYISTA